MSSHGTRSRLRRLIESWLSRPLHTRVRARAPYRLGIERLEDRVVPTTFTVENTNSTGAGSLYAAVQSANGNTSSASLINFDPAVFSTPQTITLTNSLALTNASKPVTIQGPSNVTVTISGDNQIQDFVINTTGVVAAIQNLTIANGNGGSSDGGGFLISAGNVTIDRCSISNNIAGDGGGITLSGGNLLLENSVITGNSTNTTSYGNGGGIATSGGTLTIIGCLFTQNVSNNNTGGHGGAIDEQNAIMTVIDSTFIGNTAAAGTQQYGGNGGAICSESSPSDIGTNYIIGCTFTGNAAQNGTGGGIAAGYYYNLTLLNDLIWNNTALTGPDLANDSSTHAVNNTLIGNAGGVYIPAGSSGDIVGVSTSPGILGSLASNGGPTQSMMPVANSPEIGAGGNITTANAAITSASASTVSVANGYYFAASSITPALSFVNQPANTTTGAPMSPVTVQVSFPVDFDEDIKIDNEIMEVVGHAQRRARRRWHHGHDACGKCANLSRLRSARRGQRQPGIADIAGYGFGSILGHGSDRRARPRLDDRHLLGNSQRHDDSPDRFCRASHFQQFVRAGDRDVPAQIGGRPCDIKFVHGFGGDLPDCVKHKPRLRSGRHIGHHHRNQFHGSDGSLLRRHRGYGIYGQLQHVDHCHGADGIQHRRCHRNHIRGDLGGVSIRQVLLRSGRDEC
jgi:hypothetical protein